MTLSTHPDAIDHKIADFYKATIAERGYPPTFAEIGAHVGFSSKDSVAYRMRIIEGCGLIPGYRRRKAVAS